MSLNAEILLEGFEAAARNEDLVTLRFYEILFERYPSVKPLFGRNSQENQAKMLQESLIAVIDNLEDQVWLTNTLQSMGQKHVSYEVTEEMYPWVGECLIATLAELAGDSWTKQHESEWSKAYAVVSQIMISGAKQSD